MTIEKELASDSPEATQRIAAKIAKVVKPGDIILLTGDLGAGKTTFVQALAGALGISENVTSPSFMLLKEYMSGSVPLFHFDAYRLDNIRDFIDLGYRDYLFGPAVSVIEWGDKVLSLVGEDFLIIDIHILDGSSRLLSIKGHGENWSERLRSIDLK